MELPWSVCKKTWRDRLQDIAVQMAGAYADALPTKCNISSLTLCHSGNLPGRYQKFYDELRNWRKSWLQDQYGDLGISCSGCSQVECQCFPLVPSAEFWFLAAEWLALMLLLNLSIRSLHYSLPFEWPLRDIAGHGHHDAVFDLQALERHSEWLRTVLGSTLTLPYFGQAASECPGITEGRCRSLFPTWVLAQSVPISNTSEMDWWSSLAHRLNYGIALLPGI